MRSFKNLIVLILTLFTLVPVAKAEYFTDIIVTSPNGIWTDERAYSTIDAAIADIGSAEQILLISREVSCTTLTVPSNITLKFIKEGSINNTGQLTINTKNILSEDRQIFVGSGDIDFADGSTVRSSWFPSLSSIATYTDDDNVNLTIEVDEPETVDYNITFDGRQSLKVNKGCPITIANGITLTLSGPFEAGLYQVFDCVGTGSVVFGSGAVAEVYPEWWCENTVPGTTDMTSAFLSAVVAAKGVPINITNIYIIGSITTEEDIKLFGKGILKHKNNATTDMISISGNFECSSNITFDGNKDNQTGRYAIISATGESILLNGCNFINSVRQAVYIHTCSLVHIQNCVFTGAAGHSGVLGENSIYVSVVEMGSKETWVNISNNRFVGSINEAGYGPGGIHLKGNDDGYITGIISDNFLSYCGQSYMANNLASIDAYQFVDGLIVRGNTLEHCLFQGICVSDSGDILISGNRLYEPEATDVSVAIRVQGYNHTTTLKHGISVINNYIDWNNIADGISIQGATGQLIKNVRVDGNIIKNTGYRAIYLYYTESPSLVNNIVENAVTGILVRSSEGLCKVSGGLLKNATDHMIKNYNVQPLLDWDISHVTFDTCSVPSVLATGCRNVSLTSNAFYNSTKYSAHIIDCVGQVISSGNHYDIAPLFSGNTGLEIFGDISLSTGGYQRKSFEKLATIAADAFTTIPVNIPSNARILGCTLRVDDAFKAEETWDAAFCGGSSTQIVSGAAVNINTKVVFMYDENTNSPITTGLTNICITKNGGGSFTETAQIRAIVYYEVMTGMSDM